MLFFGLGFANILRFAQGDERAVWRFDNFWLVMKNFL